MCIKCQLKEKGMQALKVANPAMNENKTRTIWGPYVETDFEKIHRAYPVLSKEKLAQYINFFHEPRLSEILGPLELIYRVLHKKFSNIRGLNLDVVYNPLSVLSMVDGKVIRVKTTESEVLHKSMEKLALRTKTLSQINQMFDSLFGVQIAFACSCGIGAVYTKDLQEFMASEYYCQREGYGRMFDSDILAVSGNLFLAESIDLVPSEVIQASRDVKEGEVESYKRYYAILQDITRDSTIVELKNPTTFFN